MITIFTVCAVTFATITPEGAHREPDTRYYLVSSDYQCSRMAKNFHRGRSNVLHVPARKMDVVCGPLYVDCEDRRN